VMKKNHYFHLHHHMSLFLLPHLEVEFPQATTSSTATVEASQVEGEIISDQETPPHIQKTHPAQQIIGNLNERLTRFSSSPYLSCFTNTLFVALFEP
jgi:hypothetical protein